MTRKMYSPEGMTAVSVGGDQITSGEDGAFDVPDEHVAELEAHGLTLHKPTPSPEMVDAIGKVLISAIAETFAGAEPDADSTVEIDQMVAAEGEARRLLADLSAHKTDAPAAVDAEDADALRKGEAASAADDDEHSVHHRKARHHH